MVQLPFLVVPRSISCFSRHFVLVIIKVSVLKEFKEETVNSVVCFVDASH